MSTWTEREIHLLRNAYLTAGSGGVVELADLAKRLGRHKSNVCRKARQIGMPTSYTRRIVEVRKDRRKFGGDADALRQHQSHLAKSRIEANGHPKGMTGKRHSDDTKAIISNSSKRMWARMTKEQREHFTAEAYRKLVESGGPPKIGRGTWKAGWREIGGKRNFYRSRWEANYARYLQWLKDRGEIKDWEHEPEVFWFEAIKRGVRSYKPDFRVWGPAGDSRLHEVKGWMDQRSHTTLARMKKYHPSETIILIDGVQYRSIRRAVMSLIPDWEDSPRDSHA